MRWKADRKNLSPGTRIAPLDLFTPPAWLVRLETGRKRAENNCLGLLIINLHVSPQKLTPHILTQNTKFYLSHESNFQKTNIIITHRPKPPAKEGMESSLIFRWCMVIQQVFSFDLMDIDIIHGDGLCGKEIETSIDIWRQSLNIYLCPFSAWPPKP